MINKNTVLIGILSIFIISSCSQSSSEPRIEKNLLQQGGIITIVNKAVLKYS